MALGEFDIIQRYFTRARKRQDVLERSRVGSPYLSRYPMPNRNGCKILRPACSSWPMSMAWS